MALEVKKQFRESPQALIRRFSQGIQKSGILRRAKKNRYKIREKSKQLRRRGVLRKEELKRERQIAQKIG